MSASESPKTPRAALVDVQTVAEYLGVSTDYVYEHADELGVKRLGSGPRAPLRFDLAKVDERLTACSARGQGELRCSERQAVD